MTLKSLDPSLQILSERALILHTLHTKKHQTLKLSPWPQPPRWHDGNDNGERNGPDVMGHGMGRIYIPLPAIVGPSYGRSQARVWI